MVLPLVVAVLAVTAAVAWQALRRPMLRRLAARDAGRRPTETMLVVAGSLLGTALITGSFIVGDTLDTSIRAKAYNQLGPVDELLAIPGFELDSPVVDQLTDLDAGDDRTDGVISFLSTQAAISTPDELAEPNAQLLELDFEDARSFGSDPDITGIEGATPTAEEVVIGTDLAEILELERGDEVTAHLYGTELVLRVDRVLPQTGLAGFWVGFQATSMNAFVAPGTLESLVATEPPEGASPPTTYIAISNRGGVEDSDRLSEEVTAAIEDRLGANEIRVEDIKHSVLESAKEQGEQFGEIFIGIGSFAIIAGVLLLVNIFVMLSEERKSQLGMLRAVGMTRGHLVRVFVLEGFIYALLAGVLGTGLGIGVGWAIVKIAAPIFGSFGDFSLDLNFAFETESLILGFCAGVLISMLTIFGTSLRISRVNIIRAIRDLPEPRSYKVKIRSIIIGTVVAAGAAAMTVASWGNQRAWAALIVGAPLALFGLLPLMSRLFGRRKAVIVTAVGSLAWGIFGNAITDGMFFHEGDIFAFVIQGTLLTLAAVLLLSQSQENLEGFIRRVSAKSLPLRLSVAYPLARRARTGLTLGMFALVIFTMTFIAVLMNVFGGQVDTAVRKEGDFEILATSSITNPPSESQLESFDGVEEVATLRVGTAFFQPREADEPEPWVISAVDEEFLAGGPPTLSEMEEGVTQRETWQRLLDESGTIILPLFFLETGGGPPAQRFIPGETTVAAIDPATGRKIEHTVIGLVENDFAFSGSYVSYESIEELLGSQAAASRFYVKTESDDGAADIATRLQGELIEHGVEADPIRQIVEDFQQSNLQFFRLMEGYLALGLLVGIAGLGVVMVRAVRERRREVGVLRSLGFLPHQVRRAFVLESGFVALQGILIGVVLAIITASQLIATDAFGQDLVFEVPWDQVAVLTGASLFASLLATAWPAQQASQIPPAVALRIAD